MCRYNANGLTAPQQAFCDAYLIDHNATRAYKAGYPSIKNDETASACGSRLLGNAKVAAYIAAQEAALHRATIADAVEMREFLTAVMRGQATEQVPVYVMRGIQELIGAPAGMSSRLRAVELLAKLMGLFTDTVSVSVTQMPKIVANPDGSVEIGDESLE